MEDWDSREKARDIYTGDRGFDIKPTNMSTCFCLLYSHKIFLKTGARSGSTRELCLGYRTVRSQSISSSVHRFLLLCLFRNVSKMVALMALASDERYASSTTIIRTYTQIMITGAHKSNLSRGYFAE
jgi:hypothetical protein